MIETLPATSELKGSAAKSNTSSLLKQARMNTVGGLHGASAAMHIATELAGHQGLVITEDDATAAQVAADISFFLGRGQPVIFLADLEVLPYDLELPDKRRLHERIRALHTIATSTDSIVVTSAASVVRRLAPSNYWREQVIRIRLGDHFALDELRERLSRWGYRKVELVQEFGDIAIRKGIVDIVPYGNDHPVRIRLDRNGSVQSIDRLHLNTQRTETSGDELVTLLPGREVPFDSQAINRFRANWRARFPRNELYEAVSRGEYAPGIEAYATLFLQESGSLFNLMREGAPVFMQSKAIESLDRLWAMTQARYRDLSEQEGRHLLAPEDLWLSEDELAEMLSRRKSTLIFQEPTAGSIAAGGPFLPTNMQRQESVRQTIETLTPWVERTEHLLFSLQSPTRIEQMELICQMMGVDEPRVINHWDEFRALERGVAIGVSSLEQGFYSEDRRLAVITEREIFGQPVYTKDGEEDIQAFEDLSDLSPGEPLVHVEHGVGRFESIETLDVAGHREDYLKIRYANESSIFVKMQDLDMVMRYAGVNSEEAPLDEPGNKAWRRGMDTAQQQAFKTARELYRLKQATQRRQGIAMKDPDYLYERFAAAFPFRETRDQTRAINEVIEDLTSPKPMDRVVCGDVGFGKTEVAMRAAFIAVRSGYQVAMLAPTTLLAQQHVESFRERFAFFGMEIAGLMGSTANDKRIISDIAAGKIDIVIGTHRLLNKDVRFKKLGLAIIDEEHRFGVKQKEAMRELRGNVDVLSLTATPIPRTLGLALQGIRALSTISTAPAKRLSVRTFLRPRSDSVLKEAINRELLRGGQVFFVHNNIETIQEQADYLQELFPTARIRIGHGRMRELELEHLMADFHRHAFDILVTTTIIETGIDVPNANTILIDKADRFGLAQLHQLRGRVGRSSRQAYAYLLAGEDIGAAAKARLEAMVEASQLGRGFALARHDLEIRGAGELLGEDQSGQIQTVGFGLYMRMLSHALAALEREGGGSAIDISQTQARVELGVSAYIPDDYVDAAGQRLVLYKRIITASSVEEVNLLAEEISDRFGPAPKPVQYLLELGRLRALFRRLGGHRVFLSDTGGKIEFFSHQQLNVPALLRLTSTPDSGLTLSEDGLSIIIDADTRGDDEKLRKLREVLEAIQPERSRRRGRVA